MKKIAIYPGTFDPITNGHVDLIVRATQIFDEIIIAVSDNPRKNPLFDIYQRLELVEQVTADIPNVVAERFDDLLVAYVQAICVQCQTLILNFRWRLQIGGWTKTLKQFF